MKKFVKILALPACATALTAPCFAYTIVMINRMIDSKFVSPDINMDGKPVKAEAESGR